MVDFRILYLDNNCFVADQIKMRLEWKGYRVTTTNKEDEVVTNIARQSFDLLIIDLLTLTPHTISLQERLKRNTKLIPPIVVIDNEKRAGLLNNAFQIEYIDYVIKKPLIQSFFDQINLSVFKVFDKLKHSKSQFSNENSHLDNPPTHDIRHNKTASTKNHIQSVSKKESVQEKQTCLDNYKHFPIQLWKKTSQKQSDPNLQLKLSFLENTSDAVFISDAKNKIISINSAFTKICGYSSADILKKKAHLLNTEKFDILFYKDVAKKLKSKPFWQGEVLIRHHKGHTIPVWQSIYSLKNKTGNISESISILRDISQQKAYEETIKFQANYDSLTQLPNRVLYLDRLHSAIKLSNRNKSKLALMLLDLNKFKSINDNLGHHAGDVLLQETSIKLRAAVRNVDTVARLGGDEFAIIVPELAQTSDAELIVKKILKSFEQPILIDLHEIFISASIGITTFPDDALDAEILQQNADTAMYMAKNNSHKEYYFYTPELQKNTEYRLQMINDIRSAMHNQEFSLYYQPIIDVETKQVTSAETFLRWNHPKLGFISLNEFLPLAEESGLIRDIGLWVIEEVASNLKLWNALNLPPLEISLNQSVAEYSLAKCHIEWINILNNNHIPLNTITFEISEKIFSNENINYVNSIKQLKQAGIRISLDGFGTGYTSLNYLKDFPLDVIKIDRCYIHSMIDDPTHAIFVETIILLAHKLGVKVIATGVENQQQLALLNSQCECAQGNYFSKPLPFNEFQQFIKMYQ